MKLATLSRNRVTRRAAFTLLEVLVVVAIIVILATVASVAVFRNLEDAKKSKAQLQAQTISKAMQAYYMRAESGNTYPESPQQLLQPPWGGTSFLPNGQQDLLDPWNNPYQFQPGQGPDGSQIIFVYCTTPDNVRISQYGIGPKSGM